MTVISTQKLALFPDVIGLRTLLQSMAMLDAIVCPDWEMRYYSFDTKWSAGATMGSMRSGCGDDFFALFNSYGCFLKGFAHESPIAGEVAPENFYRGLPAELEAGVKEPAFSTDDVTFCLWRAFDDKKWSRAPVPLPRGGDPDGSATLLSPLDGKPKTYRDWAEDYYEVELPLDAVKAIYNQEPLTKDLIKSLNPEITMKDLKDDIREIGYPK